MLNQDQMNGPFCAAAMLTGTKKVFSLQCIFSCHIQAQDDFTRAQLKVFWSLE